MIESEYASVGYYGSSSYKCGPKTFFPIKFHSSSVAEIPRLSGRNESLQCEFELCKGREGARLAVTAKQSTRTSPNLLYNLGDWCLEHLDRVIDITAPGARGISYIQPRNFVFPSPFFHLRSDLCLKAAI